MANVELGMAPCMASCSLASIISKLRHLQVTQLASYLLSICYTISFLRGTWVVVVCDHGGQLGTTCVVVVGDLGSQLPVAQVHLPSVK